VKVLLTIVCLFPLLSQGQKIENIHAEVAAEKVVVTYDLVGGEASDSYTVSLYASHNNFRSPLTRVRGDIGAGIEAGRGKRIEWEAKAEMGAFKGELTFEVEAIVVAPLVLKTTLSGVKRSSTQSLQWRGGDHSQNVRIELLKDGQVQNELASVNNNGSFSWTVPGKQKPGNDYTLRLVNGRETVTSTPFTIKPRIPTWVKIAVPVVIAGVLLIPKGSEPSQSNRLPEPPSILD